MVRFTTPVTGILAAEMADASAGWPPTVKRNALVHPPPSQHPLISLPSTLAPLANGPTAIGPRPLRSFEPLQSVTALSTGWDISERNAQVLIYYSEGHAIGIDSAHYEMLAEVHGPASAPTELFQRAVLFATTNSRS